MPPAQKAAKANQPESTQTTHRATAPSTASSPVALEEVRNSSSSNADTTKNPDSNSPTTQLNPDNIEQVWQMTIESCGDMTSDMASQYRKLELAKPDKLVVTFKDKYTSDMCSRPERKEKLEAALRQTTGQSIRIDFVANIESPKEKVQPQMTRVQKIRQLEKNPLVQSALELFDGEVVDFHQSKRID